MKPDAQASLCGAWQTLEQLVGEGKIKHIGVSNYNQAEMKELLSYARIRPAINQIELHPRLPQMQLVKFCQSHNIGVTAYSPPGRDSKPRRGCSPTRLFSGSPPFMASRRPASCCDGTCSGEWL